MNKLIVLISLLLTLVSKLTIAVEPDVPNEIPIVPESPDGSAVSVNIGSSGGPLDYAALNAIRRIVGSAVATGVVDTFVATGGVDTFDVNSPRDDSPIPIEGGESFCAEAGFNPPGSKFRLFVDEMKTVQPEIGTFISIQFVDHCPVTLEDDDSIVCTEDAKMCPDGTFVGRVPPSCEFEPCPGIDFPTPDEPYNGIGDKTGQLSFVPPPRGLPIDVIW